MTDEEKQALMRDFAEHVTAFAAEYGVHCAAVMAIPAGDGINATLFAMGTTSPEAVTDLLAWGAKTTQSPPSEHITVRISEVDCSEEAKS